MVQETLMARLLRKNNENPVVLPGLLSTLMCGILMIRIQRTGTPAQLYVARRLRIACQAFTLLTATGGMAYQLFSRKYFPTKLQQIERDTLNTFNPNRML